MSSLLVKKEFGGSMVDLKKFDSPEKEPKGLLRRAFSSRRRKKKVSSSLSGSPGPCLSPHSPNLLSPRELMPPMPHFYGVGGKESVCRVRSNPFPSSPDG